MRWAGEEIGSVRHVDQKWKPSMLYSPGGVAKEGPQVGGGHRLSRLILLTCLSCVLAGQCTPLRPEQGYDPPLSCPSVHRGALGEAGEDCGFMLIQGRLSMRMKCIEISSSRTFGGYRLKGS